MPTGTSRWLAGAALLVLTTANVPAADWTVSPDITLRETYTDNAFIGTTPRRHDFVTEVTPGIRIDGRGPRLTASLGYRPSLLFYARHSEANDVANHLDAFGRLEALEQLLFVEARGNVSQSFISPFAARPAELATVTPNRVETRTFSLSPYLRGVLAGEVDYELRHRNTWTSSDNDSLGDYATRQWSARAASPVRLLGWALEYDDTEIEHEDFTGRPDEQSRLARARLHWQPDPAWRLSASAGREENNFVLQETQRHSIRGAALAWRPGPRTSAELEYESRWFGPSRLARFSHRTRLTAWSLAYSRNASNFQEELLRLPPGNTAALLDSIFAARIPDPAARRAAVEEFLRASGTPAFLSASLAFYTQRIFVREGIDASFGILGARNSVTFTAFAAESTRLSADAAVLAPDSFLFAQRITQRGFGARAEHKLTPFTSIGGGATRTYSREEEPIRRDTRNDHAALSFTHTVSPATTAFAGVSITRFDSDDASVANQDATSVFVGLNHRF